MGVQIISTLSGQVPPSTPPLPQCPVPLVLHLDINETILVGDEAGGDTREESLNKILAKSAFCQLPKGSENVSIENVLSIVPTHWWDGTLINNEQQEQPPPLYTGWQWPPGCVPYYRTAYKRLAKDFVDGHGRCYKSLYYRMEEILSFEDDTLPSVMSHMLPAVFHTLVVLTEKRQPFRLVLRSFGSDINEVAAAISVFAQGKHPDYPEFYNESLISKRDDLVRGRWKESDNGETTFELWNDEEVVASGDDQVLQWIEERSVCGIRDDYEYWSKHSCEPWAGKPVWVSKRKQHHLLFDDNIHNLQHDSIASVRLQSKAGEAFHTLSGKEIQQMQGYHLIRVPTIEPILNPNWFLEQIDKARANFGAEEDNLSS
jgi:hypothetical protein